MTPRLCMLLRILLCSAYANDLNVYAQFEGLSSVSGQRKLVILIRANPDVAQHVEVFSNRYASTEMLQPLSVGRIEWNGALGRLTISVDLSAPARLVFAVPLPDGKTLRYSLLLKSADGRVEASVLDEEAHFWRRNESGAGKKNGSKQARASDWQGAALALSVEKETVSLTLQKNSHKSGVLEGNKPGMPNKVAR